MCRCLRLMKGFKVPTVRHALCIVMAGLYEKFSTMDDLKGKELLQDLKIGRPFCVIAMVQWIKWKPPLVNMMNLNVDGASKGGNGVFRKGMVLSNSKGQSIME
ncbi:unnamed protein product [Ilex paraguariensis]|uniref:Uncharacterized protein n=1 Tax=Ilex paraguariensis TaxID=185542 RepID=A0ABC8QSF0_9AQUA